MSPQTGSILISSTSSIKQGSGCRQKTALIRRIKLEEND
jgi:hypothetical protein